MRSFSRDDRQRTLQVFDAIAALIKGIGHQARVRFCLPIFRQLGNHVKQ